MIAALTALFLALVFSQQVNSQPKMEFVCTGKPHEAGYKFVEKVYQRAFAQLGYGFNMQPVTNNEAVDLLRSEKVDGDCGRISHFAELSGLTNTVSIPHAYRMVEFSSWFKHGHTIPPNRHEQRIGYNRNALFIPTYLRETGYLNTKAYADTDAMIAGLANGDVDLIMHYQAGMASLKTSPHASQISFHNHILSMPVHGLLLKKHQHLTQKLSDIISRLTAASPFKPNGNRHLTHNNHLKQLHFSCSIPASNHYFQALSDLLNRAFNPMGYQITLKSMTRAREIAELKNGRIDGSCGRTDVFSDQMADHVNKIDAPLTRSRFQVWSTQPGLQISHIKEFPLESNIAVVRGTISIMNNLRRYTYNIKQVNTAKDGLQLLAEGKIDFYVDIIESAGPPLKLIQSQVPIYLSGEVQGNQTFPLLHKRYKYLSQQASTLLKGELNKTPGNHLIEYH